MDVGAHLSGVRISTCISGPGEAASWFRSVYRRGPWDEIDDVLALSCRTVAHSRRGIGSKRGCDMRLEPGLGVERCLGVQPLSSNFECCRLGFGTMT